MDELLFVASGNNSLKPPWFSPIFDLETTVNVIGSRERIQMAPRPSSALNDPTAISIVPSPSISPRGATSRPPKPSPFSIPSPKPP